MSDTDGLRYTKIPLNNGADEIPALGFGTLIPDPIATKDATKAALEVGFRQFDCAERYRNEEQVGEAMRDVFQEGKAKREDVFVGTKLWNTNHRLERVRPAFEASLRRLQLDYVDLYCIHKPRGRTPVQGYRIIERQSGTAERGLRIRTGKACCSSSRIPSISPSMGTARLLQEEWHRDAGLRGVGSWYPTEVTRRSCHHGHRQARP